MSPRLVLVLVLVLTPFGWAQFVSDTSDSDGAKPKEWKLTWQEPPKPYTVPPGVSKLTIQLPAGFKTLLASPHGSRWLVVAETGGKKARLYDFSTGQFKPFHPQFAFDDDKASLSADGKQMALWKDDFSKGQGRRLVDLGVPQTGQRTAQIVMPVELSHLNWVDFAAAGVVVTGTDMIGKPLKVEGWDGKTGQSKWLFELEKGNAQLRALSPGGHYLALAKDDKDGAEVVILDTQTGQVAGRLATMEGKYAYRTHALAWSPDGTRIVAVVEALSPQLNILVWDAKTGVQTKNLTPSDFDAGRAGLNQDKRRKLEFLDETRIVVGGTLVVDLEAGVWVMEIKDEKIGVTNVPFRVIDATRVLRATKSKLYVETIDATKLAAAAKVREAGGSAADMAMPPLKQADLSGVKQLTDTAASWGVTPDPATAKPLTRRPIRVDHDIEEPHLHVARNGAGPAILAGQGGKLVLIDLIAAKPHRPIALPAHATSRVMAISPDGTRAAIRTDNTRIDVFELDPLKHVAGWRTAEAKRGSGGIQEIEFVDNDRLLVTTGTNLTQWTVSSAKCEWERKDAGRYLHFSPGGKYVVCTSRNVMVLDPVSGKMLGTLPTNGFTGAAGFSRDGSELLCIMTVPTRGGVFTVFNLATGEPVAEGVLQERVHGAIQWVDKGLWLIGSHIVSTDKHAAIWKFRFRDARAYTQAFDRKLWYVAMGGSKGKGCVVSAIDLPDGNVTAALGKAKPPTPLLGPGMKVSLKASLDPAEKERLLARLKEGGITVDDSAPIKLVSSISTENLGTREYELMGGRGGKQTLNRSRTTRRLAWEKDGKALWQSLESSETGSSPMVRLQEGQTVQDALGGTELESRSRAFQGSQVPVLIYPDADTTVVGGTMIAVTGAAPIKPDELKR